MFQNYISMICSSRTMYAVLTMVYLISRRKITSMVFLIFFISSGYLNSLEKMLFMDPRPFWTSSAVRQFEWHCPADFGNPSGHSRSSAYFYFLLFYDLLVRDAGTRCVAVAVPIDRNNDAFLEDVLRSSQCESSHPWTAHWLCVFGDL
jgi:membrane-associated phospholipid phosphatase